MSTLRGLSAVALAALLAAASVAPAHAGTTTSGTTSGTAATGTSDGTTSTPAGSPTTSPTGGSESTPATPSETPSAPESESASESPSEEPSQEASEGTGEPEPSASQTKDADREGDVNGEDEAERLQVAAAPDAVPAAADDSATVRANATVRVRVAANDQLGGASVRVTTTPGHGTAKVAAGNTVDFTPRAGFKGSTTFDYDLVTGDDVRDTATVTVTVLPPQDVAAIDDHVVVGAGSRGVSIRVLQNDDVPEGADIAAGDAPAHGSAEIGACAVGVEFCPGDSIRYVPAAGFTGRDSFTYGVRVGGDVIDSATVTVDVVGDLGEGSVLPVDDTVTVRPGESVTFAPTDNDIGASGFDAETVTQPAHGRLTGPGGEDGRSFTYTPSPSFASGIDTFTYRLVDNGPVILFARPVELVRPDGLAVPDVPVLRLAAAALDTGTVTIIVDGPVSADDSATTDAGERVDIPVRDNDSGLSGSCLTVPSPQPMSGTARVVEGGIRYTPAPGFAGTEDFVYGYTPGCEGGGLVAQATVTVTVRPPGAADDAATTIAGDAGGLPVTIDVLDNDGGAAPDFTLRANDPARGTAAVVAPIEGRALVRYTPEPGFSGTDTFTYDLVSGGGPIATATVRVRVAKVAAAADTGYTTAGEPVTIEAGANDSLTEGVRVVVTDRPAQGTAEVVSAGRGTLRYTPGDGFADRDGFGYALVAGDGEGQVVLSRGTVTVGRVEAVADAATSAFRQPISVDVRANDTGAAPLTVEVTDGPGSGVTLDETSPGVFRVTPRDGFDGTARFTYALLDGERVVDSAEVTVEVPEASVANDDTVATDPGVAVDATVLGNDVNVTGLTVAVTGQPVHGTVEVSPAGVASYKPAAGFTGADAFGYELREPGGARIAGAGVAVTVRPPTAVDDVITVLGGKADAVDVRANDTFAGAFTVRPHDGAHGTTALEGAGVVRYTPAAGPAAADSFEYDLLDADGEVAATAVVRVTVRPVDARDDTAATQPGRGVRIGVLGNDTAPAGVSVRVVGQPADGTVVVNADGSVDYVPRAGFTGTDRFRYALTGVVRGVRVDLDVAAVTVTVETPPVTTTPGDPPGTGDPEDPGTTGPGDDGAGTPPKEPPAPTPSTPEDDLDIDLSVDSASPLAEVTVRGTGCPGSKTVIIAIDGAKVAGAVADSGGAYRVAIPAPDGIGRHEVSVTCGAGTTTSSLDVVVTTMQSGTQAPAGAAAAAAVLLLFFLLSGMGLNPTGRRAGPWAARRNR